ncbi:hypothetical protein NQ317_013999 [Molorchus minor]|uniref:Uncharacterized protein n=1 Tax=Molorchus minor TaxID=1323400 RepID=A0ABQ9J2X9_9CUCU|nr:hypothetical protein NQ317_013999 [Molorchus minor]
MSERGTWKRFIVIDSNRRALYAGIFLRTSQQLGEALYFYAEQYDIGIDVTALKWMPLTGMIIYVVFYSVVSCFVSTIVAFYLIARNKGKTLEEIQQYLKGSRGKTNR